MSNPQPVVRLMAPIVTATSAKVLSTIQAAELLQRQVTQPDATVSNIVEINYQFGTWTEIISTLKEWEKSPNYYDKKYPLVALILDIPVAMGNSGGYPGEATFTMVIVNANPVPQMKAADRYSNNMEPILLPIYWELLRQIDNSASFVTMGPLNIRHTRIEHPYLSVGPANDNSNRLPEYVDAIELRDVTLKINFSAC